MKVTELLSENESLGVTINGNLLRQGTGEPLVFASREAAVMKIDQLKSRSRMRQAYEIVNLPQ